MAGRLQIHGNHGTQPVIPKNKPRGWLTKTGYVPKRNREPQVTVAKINSRTAENGLPYLGYFPTYGRGKTTKASLVVRLGTVSHGLH